MHLHVPSLASVEALGQTPSSYDAGRCENFKSRPEMARPFGKRSPRKNYGKQR